MSKLLERFNLQLFAEAGEGGGEPAAATGAEGDKGQEAPKTFTQEELDKIVNQRLDREKKKQEKALEDLKKQLGAGGDTPPKGDASQEPNEEAQKAAAALQKANQLFVQASAVAEAVKLGADPKYTQEVIKLANLSEITVGENGEVDAAAVSKALDEVLKRIPAFKLSAENNSGFRVGGDGSAGSGAGKDSWKSSEPTKKNRWNRTNHW